MDIVQVFLTLAYHVDLVKDHLLELANENETDKKYWKITA